jgi:G:T-mismatch repair DNA endonuclease (very short patch repair protein)
MHSYTCGECDIVLLNGALGFWHGCTKCYRTSQAMKQPFHTSNTYADLYCKQITKEMAIKQAGYKLETIWSCDLEKQLNDNAKMCEYFEDEN